MSIIKFQKIAAKVEFKHNDKRFDIRDKIRLEPIFSQKSYNKSNMISADQRNNCEFINLLNKKHKIDRKLQLSFESAMKNSYENKFSNLMKLNVCLQLKKKNSS